MIDINYDTLNKASAREIERLVDIQTQQQQSKLLPLCDMQHFTTKYDKLWDMGGLEFKNADNARVKLASLESNVTMDNREFRKFRSGISVPVDIKQLEQSEVRDQYKAKISEQLRFAANRAYDFMVYQSFDATYRSSYNDPKYAGGDHTFETDGNKEFDFSDATGFNYERFRKLIEEYESQGFSDGLAFVCTEKERAKLREEITTNADYRNATGVVYDKFGRIEYLNGVKIVVFGSNTRVGNPIIGKTKNSPTGKRACFMFNTNEGGGTSAITYDVDPLNLEIIRVNDELKVWKMVGDYQIGAIRKANALVLRVLMATTN
jgi:hypothetical protein